MLARSRHPQISRACDIVLKLVRHLRSDSDGHGRARLDFKHYSLFNMPVAVPCASLPLFTSAIVPLHVSTTILDRRQTEAVVTGTWDLAMHRCLSRTAPAYRIIPILLPLHDDLLCAPSTFVLMLSTSRQVKCRGHSAAARCMIPLCQCRKILPKAPGLFVLSLAACHLQCF